MPLTRVSLRQLEAFIAVEELQSFAAASNRMGLTSSAVSQLVAELESILGFRVFDRSTRKVTLSSAGRDFLSSAQTVLRRRDHACNTQSPGDGGLPRIAQGVLSLLLLALFDQPLLGTCL